ncbi:Skeletor, isoforms B/C [Asbolus verrucosus]|uniref:Skeletor, isoforms B/C n=1 Tax=Asbolus verrucosus TaxID=1661398 RepID=A0A482V8Q8_ASBVE|nr:Skeletor, isoforms B/C [Asbolus verrucosus]
MVEAPGLCGKHPEPYYGRLIGPLQEFAHGIKGTVYAVDESTIFIKGFSYDGTGPDAFFWIGNSPRPSPEGIIIPYPEDYVGRDPPVLRAYNNTNIILRLPMGKRIRDIRWLSVWCRRFTVDFGEVFIPPNLEVPKPRVLPEFKRLAHGLRSDNISILDAKTFYIPNLHYDGAGPDAYFWVGNGTEPTAFGIKVPNEMGSLDPLRGYQGEDIEIQLPGSLTVYDIDWLAVWCVQYRHNFGHVLIPKDLDVPPALGQTKISTSTSRPPSTPTNCREFLDKRLQVRWEMKGDHVEITLSAKIREDQYVAFGLSGAPNKSQMVKTLSQQKLDLQGVNVVIPQSPANHLGELLEITVERGQTYNFIVEGGSDSSNPARYHPFYISDSNEGGFGQKTLEEQKEQKVFAGIDYDREGYPYPTAAGRYCEWAHKSIDKSAESETFEEYMETLKLECDQGEPAYLNWTVPMEAPDLLYYQCYTHNNLGWKIHVVNPGQTSQSNGEAPSKSVSIIAIAAICLLTVSAITIHSRGRIF